jgi:hypothetical protein
MVHHSGVSFQIFCSGFLKGRLTGMSSNTFSSCIITNNSESRILLIYPGPIQAETLPTPHPRYHDQLDLQQYGQLAVMMPSTTPHLARTTGTNSRSTPMCFLSPGTNWMGPILLWAHCQGMAMTNCSVLQDLVAARRIIHR